MKIGIVGLGFVGGAMFKSFELKKVNVTGYDKYKNVGKLENLLDADIIFLSLPTCYKQSIEEYNKTAIDETLEKLNNKFSGITVIKSTIEPETTKKYSLKYNLNLVHNPEFLSAKTCFEDFHNQKHIVLGKAKNCDFKKFNNLVDFYQTNYPEAEISICLSNESESMKIFCNCFYASKIQIFNELYLLCQTNQTNYENVVKLMIKNKWINPMHTKVPNDNGMDVKAVPKLSFGGLCFTKDTHALLKYMIKKGSRHKVFEAVLEERNEMREDMENIEV